MLVALAAFGVFQYAQSNPAIMRMVTLATTQIPETFTELYFENHTQLPGTITRWQKYLFSFTIHNLEYQDVDYPYSVYLQRGDEKTTLSQGVVSLKKDEYKTIEQTVGPFKDLRSKIVVELTNKNQIISFWLDGTDNSIKPVEPPKVAMALYFDGRTPLPFLVTPPDKSISFSFTFHNFKNKYFVYPYEIYLEENGKKYSVDNGQLSLKPNESRTITQSYTLTTPISQAKVFVHFPTQNNYIYFKIKGTQ